MDKYIYNEQNELWYELQGDYYPPYLKLPEEEAVHIGIWGQRHRRYLKTHRKALYTSLLTSGKLNVYSHSCVCYPVIAGQSAAVSQRRLYYYKRNRGQVFFLDTPIFCNVFYPFACGGHFIIISLSDGSGFSGANGSV